MKKQVEVSIDCNTEILYGPLDDAIKYLQAMSKAYPTIQLNEHWTGYEDMQMRFVYYRDQTPEEIAIDEAEYRRKQYLFEQKQIAARAKDERRKQYESLKREFGR